MSTRKVNVWRGTVWLGESPQETFPSMLVRYPVATWLSCELREDAPPAAPRCAAVRTACQSASGGSYFALLGARYAPAPGRLHLRVAGSAEGLGVFGTTAQQALERLAATVAGWPRKPGGELIVEYAVTHQVDDKSWPWPCCAAVLGALLAPGGGDRTDAEIDALVRDAFAAR